jgi:hypothetical protein
VKIERIVIEYNKYDFEHDGVPAKSYGARVDLVGANGRLIAPLMVGTVNSILEMAAPEVKEFIHQMQNEITNNSIIARGNLLEHDANESPL